MKRSFAMIPFVILALLALGATTPSAGPVDVTGVWTGTAVTLPGAIVLRLKQEGTQVVGTVEGSLSYYSAKTSPAASGWTPEQGIAKGSIKGDLLTFQVGTGPDAMKCEFLVRGRSMWGTIELPEAQAAPVTFTRE